MNVSNTFVYPQNLVEGGMLVENGCGHASLWCCQYLEGALQMAATALTQKYTTSS